jgi:hypothetical protein
MKKRSIQKLGHKSRKDKEGRNNACLMPGRESDGAWVGLDGRKGREGMGSSREKEQERRNFISFLFNQGKKGAREGGEEEEEDEKCGAWLLLAGSQTTQKCLGIHITVVCFGNEEDEIYRFEARTPERERERERRRRRRRRRRRSIR